MSAGRLYDKIKEKATAKVVLVTAQGTLCKVNQKNIIDMKKEIVPANPVLIEE